MVCGFGGLNLLGQLFRRLRMLEYRFRLRQSILQLSARAQFSGDFLQLRRRGFCVWQCLSLLLRFGLRSFTCFDFLRCLFHLFGSFRSFPKVFGMRLRDFQRLIRRFLACGLGNGLLMPLLQRFLRFEVCQCGCNIRNTRVAVIQFRLRGFAFSLFCHDWGSLSGLCDLPMLLCYVRFARFQLVGAIARGLRFLVRFAQFTCGFVAPLRFCQFVVGFADLRFRLRQQPLRIRLHVTQRNLELFHDVGFATCRLVNGTGFVQTPAPCITARFRGFLPIRSVRFSRIRHARPLQPTLNVRFCRIGQLEYLSPVPRVRFTRIGHGRSAGFQPFHNPFRILARGTNPFL